MIRHRVAADLATSVALATPVVAQEYGRLPTAETSNLGAAM
ncbi:hypothetical protein [Ensifer sp. BR816]|nr:hypothetical protein [Ensifer sp. BR816]